MAQNSTFKDRALQVVAVIGLIAILLLGAWGIIQLAFVLWGFLGNTGTHSPTTTQQTQTEQVAVTVPATVNSGSPFTVSFNRTGADNANIAYDISYSCADGVSMQAPLPTGKMQTVACNTPFNYTNATQNIQLTATNSTATAAAVTVTVAARNLANNTVGASGSGIVTIAAGKAASAPAKTTTTTTTKPTSSTSTYVASHRTTNLFGQPDLAVSINSVTQTAPGRYSVNFTVQNVGTNMAPAGWTFNASLPTSPTYNYTSQAQQKLYPGDKVVYTLGFTMNNYYGYNTYDYNNYNNVYYNSYPSSYQYTYSNCSYTNNYTYNGAYNYPGVSYTCPSNSSVYNYPTYVGYQTTGNYYNQYQPTPYYNTYGGSVSITVDPNNYLYESNESNNTASANAGY